MIIEQNWVTDYLDVEADRVMVDDRLYEIEHGMTVVPFSAAPDLDRPRRSSAILAMVAALVIFAGGATMLSARGTPRSTPLASAGSVGGDGVPVTDSPVVTTSAPDPTTTPAPPPVANELPAGGLSVGGQTPTCTKVYDDQYDCTLTTPLDPLEPANALYVDKTGMAELYVNSSSRVAGGCRSTSADARHWFCYVGQRAVDEQIIGAQLLGTWQLDTYIAG